jgi:hypothetical protein
MTHLPKSVMEEFGAWIAIDLATRSGQRGRRATQIMSGMFTAWSYPTRAKIRRTDFTFRVTLLVHGWTMTGMDTIRASERVAEYRLVQMHLGKRARPSLLGEGVTEKDETTRTFYNKARKNWPNLDQLFQLWLALFEQWRGWAMGVDQRTIEFVKARYLAKGEPENAAQFVALVNRVRHPQPNQAGKLALIFKQESAEI